MRLERVTIAKRQGTSEDTKFVAKPTQSNMNLLIGNGIKEAFECYLTGKMTAAAMDQRVQSYLGILSHANQYTLSQAVKNAYWVRNEFGNF